MLESFKNWVSVNESVNVTVMDHQPDEKVDSVLDICNFLFKKIIYPMWSKLPDNEKSQIDYETFSPDGDDTFKDKGMINFYVKGLSQPTTSIILSGVKYWLNDIGCTMGEPKSDTHGDKMRIDLDRIHKSGDDVYEPEYPEIVPKTVDQKKKEYLAHIAAKGIDHKSTRVIRIPIIHRDRNKEQKNNCPELNISNASAEIIFQSLLHVPHNGSGYGPMSAHDLLIAIERLTQFEKQQQSSPASTQYGDRGATMHTSEFTVERMDRILNQIASICKWAIQNHFDYITAV